MSLKAILTGLVGLVGAIACAAVAGGAVLGAHRVFDHVAAGAGPNAQLAFALVAPFGVVLFALLLEQAGRLVEWVAHSAGTAGA
jgi:hypothetical protein